VFINIRELFFDTKYAQLYLGTNILNIYLKIYIRKHELVNISLLINKLNYRFATPYRQL